MTLLAPTQARAVADLYGWNVMDHDNGGFHAICGEWQLTIAFEDDGGFRHASTQQGPNGAHQFVSETEVLGQLAVHGRPVGSEEKTA